MDELLPANADNIDQEEAFVDWGLEQGETPEANLQREFWGDLDAIDSVKIGVKPPVKPLAILETLGPSPFERGRFPLIGFLATTFDKVSQFALERAGYNPNPDAEGSPTDIPAS